VHVQQYPPQALAMGLRTCCYVKREESKKKKEKSKTKKEQASNQASNQTRQKHNFKEEVTPTSMRHQPTNQLSQQSQET